MTSSSAEIINLQTDIAVIAALVCYCLQKMTDAAWRRFEGRGHKPIPPPIPLQTPTQPLMCEFLMNIYSSISTSGNATSIQMAQTWSLSFVFGTHHISHLASHECEFARLCKSLINASGMTSGGGWH